MFQRFASLFFSESNAPEGLEEPKPFVSQEEEEEDGWLIIDLAEGPGLDSVESNPMEDLLIEHPSMSVYVTSNSLVVDRDSSEEISEGEVPEPRLERHAQNHRASLAAKAAILEKISQVRRVQRSKQLAEKHRLSQKALQRQNRARERPARRSKQHGGSFVHQPCQRHCNY